MSIVNIKYEVLDESVFMARVEGSVTYRTFVCECNDKARAGVIARLLNENYQDMKKKAQGYL